jgi:heme exporter protein D
MESFETYASALTVLSIALLLVAAGLAKKQLVWKRTKPRARRRRRS